MAADDLAPYVARSSAAMALVMLDKEVLVFPQEKFELPVLSQCWEMIAT